MIGAGILKGMAVTARNFVGSYFDKERLITVLRVMVNERLTPANVVTVTLNRRNGALLSKKAPWNFNQHRFVDLDRDDALVVNFEQPTELVGK